MLLPPLLRVNEYSRRIHTDLQKLDVEGYHSNREGGVQGECLLLQHMLAPPLQEQKGPSHNVYLVRGRRGKGTPWEEYRDRENKKYPQKCMCSFSGRKQKENKTKKQLSSTSSSVIPPETGTLPSDLIPRGNYSGQDPSSFPPLPSPS